MAFIGSVEDRLAIRELFGAYADASATGDREAWLACWAEDCRWTTPLGDVAGKPQLSAQWDAAWADWQSVAFFNEIGRIEVDGTEAKVASSTREIVALKNGQLFKLVGRYEDRLVKQSGEWLYKLRVYSTLISEGPG